MFFFQLILPSRRPAHLKMQKQLLSFKLFAYDKNLYFVSFILVRETYPLSVRFQVKS